MIIHLHKEETLDVQLHAFRFDSEYEVSKFYFTACGEGGLLVLADGICHTSILVATDGDRHMTSLIEELK